MKKKNIYSAVLVSLGTVGVLYGAYRRMMKVSSRGYKNSKIK